MVAGRMRALQADDRGCAPAPLQRGSRGFRFFADVAHTNDARRIPNASGAGDLAGLLAVRRQRRARLRNLVAGEKQRYATAVYVAARTHSLDNLLACVAALGVAKVAVFEASFVWNLFFTEV